MAIQFQCPGCNQPIEVDDQWSSRPVACPYCRQTVTAPAASTLDDAAAPPMASPLGGLRPSAPSGTPTDAHGAPGPVPFHDTLAVPAGESNPFAPWALGLSCLGLLVFLAINITMGMKVMSLAGPDATPEEVRETLAEMQKDAFDQAQAGTMPGWVIGVVLGMLLVFVLWVAGVILTVLAMRRPIRRGMSIGALVVCGVLPMLICAGSFVGV
ncbi:MAG: hypothetical protein JSV19_00650 [Phycisphaerales bacterium]|nr:MAG: hypothetical protein JSV19_00650 [Phycisphaerales bacterium]